MIRRFIDPEGYECEFSVDDHSRLHDALVRVRGKVIVSLNDCAKDRELYQGRGWRLETV